MILSDVAEAAITTEAECVTESGVETVDFVIVRAYSGVFEPGGEKTVTYALVTGVTSIENDDAGTS